MYLVFDTETNGLPKAFRSPMEDINNWPRMTQFGWQLIDERGDVLREHECLIKPNGWTIPKEKFFIDNNMSTERCEKEGIEIFTALRFFQDALKLCNYKVAHNIAFDKNIVGAELIRAGIEHNMFKFKPEICTMKQLTSFCNIPHKNGKGVKWPKLEELHEVLFNHGFEGAHDAMADVSATSKCLIEAINRGLIKIN